MPSALFAVLASRALDASKARQSLDNPPRGPSRLLAPLPPVAPDLAGSTSGRTGSPVVLLPGEQADPAARRQPAGRATTAVPPQSGIGTTVAPDRSWNSRVAFLAPPKAPLLKSCTRM